MWQLTAEALHELGQSHTAVSRVDVLHAGRPVRQLVAVSGEVNAEAGRAVARNLQAVLVDPTGELTGGDIDDLLSPYAAEVAPYRGVVVGGREELAPLGIFGLTDRSPRGDGSVAITGQDRAMNYQGPMTGALSISAGTPIEKAIEALLLTRNRGLSMTTWKTGFTCGPLLYEPDVDVWREAQDLARSVGGWLHHDRTGVLTFSASLPATRRPVTGYAEGDGLLLSVDRSEDADTIRNVVVVQTGKTSSGGVIRAVAEDTDPASPTYAGGRYGRRPVTITNQHIATQDQAKQVAAIELVRQLGRSESVAFTAVVNPTLDPWDIVTVTRLRSGLDRRALIVSAVTIPLGVVDPMQVTARRSIITQDGTAMDTPDEMTTA